MAEDFSLDLEELRQLQSIAKRPRVVSLISSEILKLEKVQSLKQPASVPAPAPIATGVKVLTPAVNYVTLGSFTWNQDPEKFKVYVILEGVGLDNIETEFKPLSINVKFHDVQGKNYRCAIPKLNKEIVPEKCKVTVKLAWVIITLFKASEENWPDLHFKEDRVQSLMQPASVPALAPIPAPIGTGVKVITPAVNYVTLGSYTWNQDPEKVKVYVILEGVGLDNMETEFKPLSINVKFHDVQGKNYRCAIPKLNKEIVPEKCEVTVKLAWVIITLFKASEENWPDLHFKEDSVMKL